MPTTRARVVLGVSGGIAAYKAAELCRALVQEGFEVQPVLTRGARQFVSPLTFAVLSGREVPTEIWGDGNRPAVEHVRLADRTDLLIVAPATAHTIGKLANGLADDFLSTYFLSHRGPVLLAPAMETVMWDQPSVRSNRDRLAARGVRFVGPGSGFLASGHEGVGRMAEPAEILEAAKEILSRPRGDLAGLRLLVTAGPTREPVDPVRFVSNRSSGRMGYALAEAARDRGADVTLLSGPTGLPRPEGMRFVSFETSSELHARLLELFPDCDGLAMAAAVSDFIPEERRERLHRSDGDATVRLAAGRDVLASLRPLRRGQTVIAFAAETEDLEENGRRKMDAKGADLIVVNDVGRRDAGFESPDNEVLIVSPGEEPRRVSLRPKREVADAIWDAFVAVRDRARARA
ncbi:MAG TPA: bifunctional phosphopantothenoylcysteine decarboxylase/phosphopantothenate--cysteine ligase CoaBC [Thermoanaerobaculia bacterium]|nr:bifunctional phosphopantothenoylcysteine decarboxylase/phosphopantothenate--cysteine ligase CoaBC [Thermoanaerobaculia bacterium]